MHKRHWLIFVVAVAGCGDPPVDPQGQALASAAARATTTVESAAGATTVLSSVDIAAPDPAALDDAIEAINLLLGSCVHAERAPAPSLGIDLQFADGGCELPLTSLDLAGGMDARVTDGPDGRRLDVTFRKLELASLALDGALSITRGDGTSSYRFDHLQATFGDRTITLDGSGSSRVTWSGRLVFSGDGAIATEEGMVAFRATDVERGLRDCYPSAGAIEVSATIGGEQVKATLRFDGDSADSGKVYLDYRGRTVEYQLPARACR